MRFNQPASSQQPAAGSQQASASATSARLSRAYVRKIGVCVIPDAAAPRRQTTKAPFVSVPNGGSFGWRVAFNLRGRRLSGEFV